jgi:hypothetical protein
MKEFLSGIRRKKSNASSIDDIEMVIGRFVIGKILYAKI